VRAPTSLLADYEFPTQNGGEMRAEPEQSNEGRARQTSERHGHGHDRNQIFGTTDRQAPHVVLGASRTLQGVSGHCRKDVTDPT
jgi:hypothetical protein